MLDRVERFRRERNSGREIYSILNGEEWEALLLFDDQHDAYRRGFDIKIAQGFALMAAMTTRG